MRTADLCQRLAELHDWTDRVRLDEPEGVQAEKTTYREIDGLEMVIACQPAVDGEHALELLALAFGKLDIMHGLIGDVGGDPRESHDLRIDADIAWHALKHAIPALIRERDYRPLLHNYCNNLLPED